MTVRRIQTAITLPKGKRAPEFYGLGLHSARRQAGVSVGIGILGCNGSRYRKVLRSSCRYLPYIAMKNDLVAQNVAMKVDRPKKNDFQPVFLDVAERQHLFEVIKCTKLELPVLVAAFYGLLRGEVLGLMWDAIDFERGTLTIKRTVTSVNVGGKTQIIEQESAKTKYSMRTGKIKGIFCGGQGGAGTEQAGLRQLLQL